MGEVTDPALLAILETPQTSINAPPKPAKPLPAAERTKLEDQVTALASMDRAANLFKDDFAGLGAGLENRLQEYLNVGTTGQRDWWADFKLTDSALRNALFGASLTPGEKASFEQTTVSPGMSPEIIRENLERRRKLARDVLTRRAKSLKAGPYDSDEISAMLGEYDPDLPQSGEPPPLEVNIVGGQPYPGKPGPLAVDVTDDRREGESDEEYQRRSATESFSFTDGLKNTAVGLAQGAAAIPDAIGGAMRAYDYGSNKLLEWGADAIGWDWAARAAREGQRLALETPTMGNLLEEQFPTPAAPGAGVQRFVSSLAGGAASLPRKVTNALTNAFVGKVPPPTTPVRAFPVSRSQVASEAKDLGIDVMPATVGGPTTRLLSAATTQTPGGAYQISRGVERMVDQGRKALQQIAKSEGTIANAETAGERATQGALAYRSASRTTIGRLYDAAAGIAADLKVAPTKAVKTLDDHLANLDQIPGGTEGAKYLSALRAELTTKFANGVTVQGIRGMRTQLRDKFFKDGLRGSDLERRANEIVQSISDDLADSLTASGKSEAADIYRQADAAWAARVATLDNFIAPIIGRKGEKSGEEVFQALQRVASGNGPKLREFIEALPEEEAGMVRASLINALGKSKAGAQNAAGDSFTFDGFLTQWNNLGERARNALFTGEGREAIDKLARVADQVKRTGRYTNTSNTGAVFMTGLTGSAGFAGFDAVLAALGTQATAGWALQSPKLAVALSKIGTSRSPAEAKEAIRALSTVAARNPAIADDIAGLQQRLLDSLGEPGRLAAEDDKRKVGP